MATYEDLKGLTAAVTGAAGGIGRACAQALAAQGAKVAVLDLPEQEPAGRETVEQINRAHSHTQALWLPADVRDPAALREAAKAIERDLGPLKIWVNNAGLVVRKPALEVTEEDWDRVVDVTLRGVFFASQAAAAQMKATGGGAIVNIASVYGLTGGPNRAAYTSAKGGVVNLTRSLAVEWSEHGIRVNAVAPCFVRTPMTERLIQTGLDVQNKALGGRLAELEDVANSVLFLSSAKAARMVTGQTLAVDGGWTAW